MKKGYTWLKQNKYGKEIIYIFINIILTLVCVIWVYQLWNFDFSVPITYEGDGIGALVTIEKAINNRPFWQFDFFKAPYGENLFAQDYLLPYILIKCITLFTDDLGYATNVFWLLTYVLTAITGYLFLRKIGVKEEFSIAGSIIYNFLPYHFFRLQHFWLMGYFLIPMVGYIIFGFLFAKNNKNVSIAFWKDKKFWIYMLVCFIIGLGGIYYVFFSILLIGFAAFYATINNKNLRYLFVMFCFCIAMLVPIIVFYVCPAMLWGGNEISGMAAERNLTQIDVYGLQLLLLLLPIPGHRIKKFSEITDFVYKSTGVITERYTVTLGIIMSIGFIVSLVFVLIGNSDKPWKEKIKVFGIMNFVILLIGTIGGIDNFIAMFISSSIRCYNRMSVFLALFSVGVIMILFNQIFDRQEGKYQKISIYISIIICIVGVLDQTSPYFARYGEYDIQKREYVNTYSNSIEDYYDDKQFFQMVSSALDNEKMLYIMPAQSYYTSEVMPYNRMKINLLTQEIKTSYTVSDSKYQIWCSGIETLGERAMFDMMYLMGFSGILIDKNSYSDEEAFNFEKKKIEKETGIQPIENKNGSLFFYSMVEQKQNLLSRFSNSELEQIKTAIYEDIYEDFSWIEMSQFKVSGKEQLEDGMVVARGETQYGPYITLEKGTYQILVQGENLADSSVWVTADYGEIPIEVMDVDILDKSILYNISLDCTQKDMEFLLRNNKRDAHISGYFIKAIENKKDKEKNLRQLIDNSEMLTNIVNKDYALWKVGLDSFWIEDKQNISDKQLYIKKGDLQYGPYITLTKGMYRISVVGKGLQNARPEVTFNAGKEKQKIKVLAHDDNKLVYEFSINSDKEQTEFLLVNMENNMEIQMYICEKNSKNKFPNIEEVIKKGFKE